MNLIYEMDLPELDVKIYNVKSVESSCRSFHKFRTKSVDLILRMIVLCNSNFNVYIKRYTYKSAYIERLENTLTSILSIDTLFANRYSKILVH